MNARRHTPTIEIAIGREMRLYHAYITTAPPTLRCTGDAHHCRASLGRVRMAAASSRSMPSAQSIGAARARRRQPVRVARKRSTRRTAPLHPGRPGARRVGALQDSLWTDFDRRSDDLDREA